ncbi:hypothetical protein [Levilactobacillus brevis]|uniref:hypothetical protein n=1 Tax=Levilactobacillus brevis TaxID=1580 RepID=UPI00086844ED|nr:hypothetical protein [Levilactobacillus brevis]ODP93248.1 hypothetical protein BGC39_02055 [Levilactobacillus brevis]
MRTKIVIVCLTLISLVALTASDADASVRYRSMPNFLTGHWTIRWSDGGLNSSDLKFRKRTVKSGNHNYHIKYVTKTKKTTTRYISKMLNLSQLYMDLDILAVM